MKPTISTAIGHRAAQTLYYAIEQAERIKYPLTHLATLNFSSTVCHPHRACAAFQTLRLHHFNKWAARPRVNTGPAFPPTYFYAFENATEEIAFTDPDGDHNVHVHWALHLPLVRVEEFSGIVWEWMDRVAGGGLSPTTVDITPADAPKGLRKYLLKGTDPKWAAMYGTVAKPQGIIVGGRRSNTSQNLGPNARINLDRALGIRRRIPIRPQTRSTSLHQGA